MFEIIKTEPSSPIAISCAYVPSSTVSHWSNPNEYSFTTLSIATINVLDYPVPIAIAISVPFGVHELLSNIFTFYSDFVIFQISSFELIEKSKVSWSVLSTRLQVLFPPC